MSTTREIVLKKSELAKLKGLGNSHEMVAKHFGVKESEIKDAMMTFGLSKAKPKAKKEAEYVIVLSNDVEEVSTDSIKPTPTDVSKPLPDVKTTTEVVL